tara:strand:+ start:529 stop:669 length:141 start_codon:yes stop_codon:yes gene_type:complete
MKNLKLTEKELKLLMYKIVNSTSDEKLDNENLLISKLYNKLHDLKG